MSKYSVLFEADTYHEIGPFRFPVYHDCTPGETKGFDKLNKAQASSTYKSMQLAQRIAKDHNIKASEALKILGNISADENQDYLFQYIEDVQALSDKVLNPEELKAEYVTLFMQMRGEVRLPESDHWSRTDDWTSEDTDSMPANLIRQIHEFITWEREGWPEEAEEGKESSPSNSTRTSRATTTR